MRVGWMIYGLVAAGVILACRKDHPTTSLPPITKSGEHTLGFFANGESWTPNDRGNHKKYELPKARLTQNGKLKISATRIDESKSCRHWFCIEVAEGCFKPGRYPISNESCKSPYQTFFYGSNANQSAKIYSIDTTAVNYIEITYLNKKEKIVSGTFEFDAVSESQDTLKVRSGRFDLQLK